MTAIDEKSEFINDLLISIPALFDYHELLLLADPILKNEKYENVISFKLIDQKLHSKR